jgi:hypothetical protein
VLKKNLAALLERIKVFKKRKLILCSKKIGRGSKSNSSKGGG